MGHVHVRQAGRALVASLVVAALAVPLGPPAAQAAEGATQRVSFRGVSVTVPAAWPVIRLGARPGCVRLDRHAVYLGDPSESTCPSRLVGRRTAVHLTTERPQGTTPRDVTVAKHGEPVRVVVWAGSGRRAARRIAETVAYADGDTGLTVRTGAATPPDATSSRRDSGSRSFVSAGSSRSLADTTYTGPGFDTCTARPLSEMAAWFSASPYKAANIYIGGASRGCAQPELTASWVSSVIAQGWVLIPTYVGLQAPCVTQDRITTRIDPAQASAQGIAAADDAVAQLNALGLGIGNPIYFDMEAFTYSDTACRQAVLDFLDSWTAQLHYRGYVSGLYGSASSTIRAVVSQLSNPAFDQPDQLWIARWCPDPAAPTCDTSTNDPEVPADQWDDHQRIKQYRGGHLETWGGVTINIDNNTVDAAVSPSQLAAEGSFVAVTGTSEVYRIAGGAPVFTSTWESVGLPPQPVQYLSPTQFASLPQQPDDGTFLIGGATGNVYRVAGGVATFVRSWAPYGGPQPTVTVDQAALDNAGTGGVWNHLVSGRPTVRTTGPTEGGTIASKARFGYQGGVSSSAVASYDVRWRKARWDGTYGTWTRPATWQRTAATDVPLGLRAGHTYCVSVRARNRAGQLSGWSGSRCLARALDDRRLDASAGWRERKGSRYYAGTFLATKQKGATLTLDGARLKRVGVVATVCPACGKVHVLVDGHRVGRVNLAGPATRRRQVIMLPAFRRQRGAVTLKVRSSDLRVQIDGLVVSRS